MAVTRNDTVIILTAGGDEIAAAIKPRALRWVSKAAGPGDDIQLVESTLGNTSEVIWESVAAGAYYVESDNAGGRGFDFRNGLRIGVIDSGSLYVYL